MAGSCQRAAEHNTYNLIVDPRQIICTGPHLAFNEAGTAESGGVWDIEPRHLKMHHYVEMLEEDSGRCTNYHSSCNVPDSSILWVVEMLQKRGLPHRPGGAAGQESATQQETCLTGSPAACRRGNESSSEEAKSVEDQQDDYLVVEAHDCFTSTDHFWSCCCELQASCWKGDSHSFAECCAHLMGHCKGSKLQVATQAVT